MTTTPASNPAIIDLDAQQAPSHSGQAVLGIFGVLVGALLVKSLPWLTPVWLGPPLLAAVLADIWSLWVVHRERERFAGLSIYRLTLPGRIIHVPDESAVKALIRWSALWPPLIGGVAVALLTAGYFLRQGELGLSRFNFRWHSLLLHCMPFLAAAAGIFLAVLITRAVLAWRLQQALLRAASLPHRHVLASTTFVICSLLGLFVLGDFGRTAYETLKPKPPPKVLGDLLFSSLTPLGNVQVEHRESLAPSAPSAREIYLADPRDPSKRTLLFRYERAAKVTFSPDESRLIVSEKKNGRAGPVFAAVRSIGAGATSFIAPTKDKSAQPITLDDRIRDFYFRNSDRQGLGRNIWIGEWAEDGKTVIFSSEREGEVGTESNASWFCAWDFDSNQLSVIDGNPRDAREALASFVAVKARKLQEALRRTAVACIETKIAGENRRDLGVIDSAYASEAVQSEYVRERERFQLWPEGKETLVGEIEVGPQADGKWRAKWKTSASLRAPERRESAHQDLEYDCELIEQAGRFRIAVQKIRLLKEEKVTETPAKVAVEVLRPEMKKESSPLPKPLPVLPKALTFPEGTWARRLQKREEHETIVANNVITVRGTSFRYDMNSTRVLNDPINHPWLSPIMRGRKQMGWTERYTGKVIRSDARSFVVKISSLTVTNKSPAGIVVDVPLIKGQSREWTFVTGNGGIFDEKHPDNFFEKVNTPQPGEGGREDKKDPNQ